MSDYPLQVYGPAEVVELTTGYAGPKGDTGTTGAKGDTGAQGIQGVQGVKGDTGSQGIQGLKGDTGNPTVFELRGTGHPEGVVTANPGTYYSDTAVTCGAIRWVKVLGVGNTGWRIVYGDTGWRSITALNNGWTGGLFLRRIGDTVRLHTSVISAAAATGNNVYQQASGFQGTGVSQQHQLFTASGAIAGRANFVPFFDVSGWTTASTDMRGSFTYITADPWPTVLPGTAV